MSRKENPLHTSTLRLNIFLLGEFIEVWYDYYPIQILEGLIWFLGVKSFVKRTVDLKCVWTAAYSIASIEPKFALVGGQNIPVTDLLMEVVEFETGPFLAEETEPKMRKGVASRFLTDLPIGWLNFFANTN